MKYTEEQKGIFINKYREGESISDICLCSGIARSTFYLWLKSAKYQPVCKKPNITNNDIAAMNRKIKRQEQIIEILKKVNCTASASLKVRLNELEQLYGQYSIHVLCDALEVDRGTFYNHIFRNKKDNNSYRFRREQLGEKIKQIYDDSNQIYGAKKIKAVLNTLGEHTSDRMVAELMDEMNLRSIRSEAKKNYKRFNN